jgi:hypothetical protein
MAKMARKLTSPSRKSPSDSAMLAAVASASPDSIRPSRTMKLAKMARTKSRT